MIHIAVTGTKGKSTTLRMMQHILMEQKKNVWGSYGIDGRYYNGKVYEKREDAEDYLFIAKPSDAILTEATSYVIDKKTYPENSIDAAIFTSFDGTEHLELHKDSETYLSVKKKIFDYVKPAGIAVVCRDIPEYDQIVKDIDSKIISYGMHEDSDYVISEIDTKLLGTRFVVNYKDTERVFITRLIGDANIQNVVSCFIVATEYCNLKPNEVIQSIESFPGLKGRGNLYRIPDIDTEIVIDYAHTAGSLEHLLETTRKVTKKKIVCIFGCGGQKSKKKRPLMGIAAKDKSDLVILTNDNPRKEHPQKIVEDILSEVKNKDKFKVILDRGQAIKTALTENPGSFIIITGKGDEDIIEVNGIKFPYNDHETVLTWVIQNQYNMMKAQEYVD